MSENTGNALQCCHPECDMTAAWCIKDGSMPDQYAVACTLHVGDLLQDGKLGTVWLLVGTVDVGGLKCSQGCVESGIERLKAMQQGVRDLRRSMDEHWFGKTVEAVWEEFWKDIVCKEDGRLDWEQIKKELYDYKMLMRNVTRVYCHVTGDTISKPFTDPNDVCQLADEHYQMYYEELHEEDEEESVIVDVRGLPEFDHLLTVLKTILIVAKDNMVKSFIMDEVKLLNDRMPDFPPITRAFDILADLPKDIDHSVAISLCDVLAALDDARELANEKPHLHVVLDSFHKYLDGMVKRNIASVEDAN